MFTDHFVSGQFNETNHVLLLQTDSGITGGHMINSYGRESIVFGYMHNTNQPISFGLVMATGYEPEDFYLEDHLDSTPIVAFPVISFNKPVIEGVTLTANVVGVIVFNAGVKLQL